MVGIQFSGDYQRLLRKLLEKHPELRDDVDGSVGRFRKNSKDTRLHTHALKKRMRGKYAFSVTDDIRIIFIWFGKSAVRFLAIGDHKQVYGKTR